LDCNVPMTPATYTLSLHDALPIYRSWERGMGRRRRVFGGSKWEARLGAGDGCHTHYRRAASPNLGGQGDVYLTANYCKKSTMQRDRKSTRLNSSHSQISYAVFCLK